MNSGAIETPITHFTNPYLPGDANLDGQVDDVDFMIWHNHQFTALRLWSRGDFDANGLIDVSDFNIWNQHKGQSNQSQATTLPEPSVGVLMVYLGFGVARRKIDSQRRRLD